jgi:hypothetical protein
MASARLVFLLMLGLAIRAIAAAPALYGQSAYEGPVSADADDLLMIAGYGLAAGDTVVYAAADPVRPVRPAMIPRRSSADAGLFSVVSTGNAPYSLVVKSPPQMRADRAYALWVRDARGEWSVPLIINDVRPLWITPAFVYATRMPAALPREIKVVGRNMQGVSPQGLRVRLIGPRPTPAVAYTSLSANSDILGHYVARMPLPERLAPGRYRVEVSRDGASWRAVEGQSLEVLQDPPAIRRFSVTDPRFGGCRPDDGADDTPCIIRAIHAAARAGGGSVYLGPGTWDLIDAGQPELVPGEGIVVAAGVDLEGAGRAETHVQRHALWNERAPTAAFTLLGDTRVSGLGFHDLQTYQSNDRAGPILQIGEDWQRSAPESGAAAGAAAGDAAGQEAIARDIVITQNSFDKVFVAVGSGGLPIERLFVTFNEFGAYNSALELSGDQFDMQNKFRLDDSVFDHNIFKPGSKLDPVQKAGTVASELGAGHRDDFSQNTADGAATDTLYSPDDAKGWRAAFFWNLNNNVEEVLISQNFATCTGDKIGDGEAFSFDNNTNTFAFRREALVVNAAAASMTVSEPLAARQKERDVPLATYYLGHWVQIVSGPGIGQARKIVGYTTDRVTGHTTFRISPEWDVVPAAGRSALVVGRVYWQLYVLDNEVDNRQPLCQKSNRSRRAGGAIVMWAPSVDSVIADNHQYDSDGILVQQNYMVADCADCTMVGYFQSFLDIRSNIIDGEYDWANDCSASGIGLGVASAAWGDSLTPTVSFGVSIAHNSIRHADALHGGAIAQLQSWTAGPEPHRWPLSESVLIHHNAIADIDGAPALPICATRTPRVGIAFPETPISWHTVLYANSCKHVSRPLGVGAVDPIEVCPSPVADSCECPPPKMPDRAR